MGDSSDSEEFYDAEEFTPVRGSKRSSLCRNINVTEGTGKEKEKTPTRAEQKEETVTAAGDSGNSAAEVTPVEDDRNTVKNVVQGRRRFQELRRCMQTEEEDEGVLDAAGSMEHQAYALEQPFKIIAHDTMSLQSMTSLGRIGRILSGASESHPNIRDTAPALSLSSREPSTISDDPLPNDNRQPNVLAMAEPDVIASTKANSLKQNRGSSAAIVAMSGSSSAEPRPASVAGPVAPPRKKKRNKLHGSQSLSMADGDNLSICTTDTDEYHYVARRPLDKPQLENLHVEPLPLNLLNQTMALPSPASTIESLTREFQDSLELSHSKYALDRSSNGVHESRSLERSRGSGSGSSRGSTAPRPPPPLHQHQQHQPPDSLHITDVVRGEYVVRPQDDDRARSGGTRTHSESRTAPTTGHSSLGSSATRYDR
ncbi:uncharacterized protein LOC113240437 [Hyposmocoma kahamanoa]|uniref:uncharacterized protein LOC113240437 n=1 Tax=Hyposmocoma kahamanoa TaxID=1477025 RepID=UPI000E6D8B9B|nr:uncharacterized protein LOC113240437 [Hyposmocoma kahamanoa]